MSHIRTHVARLAALLALSLAGCSIEGTPDFTRDRYDPPDGATPWTPPATTPQPRRVTILHTNDEHSSLLGSTPVALYPFQPKADGTVSVAEVAARIGQDTKTEGGIARRRFLIDKLRAESAAPVLLVSAGDAMMGTVMHIATSQAAPDYLAMALVGYDFIGMGNHDFDFGPDTLSAAIRRVHNTVFGGAVPILAGNLHFDDVQAGKAGSDLKDLYGDGDSGAPIMPWATKRLSNGLLVGFVQALGYEAALFAPAKSPLSFSVPTNGAACSSTTPCATGLSCTRGHCVNPLDAAGHVAAMVAEVQAHVNTLRQQKKVDLVVMLSHLGTTEDTALAKATTGIDVIIGGHSHEQIAPTTVASLAGAGSTVIVQAGYDGKRLGQLTLEVSPQGAVSVVSDKTLLHPVDHTLDAQIYAGTNLAATPPVVSPAFQKALKLTGTAVGPVVGALNAALQPQLGVSLFQPVIASGHDILGDVPNADSNLIHLVTDAELALVKQGMCMAPGDGPVVAVQANGVIRGSLRFGAAGAPSATFADVFGTVPLGASPWAAPSVQLPGYPVTLFRLSPAELFAGADIGVSRGLVSDSFFLSYAGMRVSYDDSLAPFDKATFDPMSTAPGGRVVKIELGSDQAGWTTLYQYSASVPWAGRWTGINPSTGLVTIVSNLYLTGYLDGFGIKLRRADGTAMTLPETVLCQTMQTTDCSAGTPVLGIRPCLSLAGATTNPVQWPYPEVKEWMLVFKYLATGLGGQVPAGLYAGATPASPRVIHVQ